MRLCVKSIGATYELTVDAAYQLSRIGAERKPQHITTGMLWRGVLRIFGMKQENGGRYYNRHTDKTDCR